MDKCMTCHRELEPGYDFCHYCGAPVHLEEARPSQAGLVDLVDNLKRSSSALTESTAQLRRSIDRVLGSPVSIQRQIAFTLMIGLVFVLFNSGANNTAKELLGPLWQLEQWLLISLFLLPFVSYWLTGVIPLSGFVNTLLGPELSARRRVLLALLISTPAGWQLFKYLFILFGIIGVSDPSTLIPTAEVLKINLGIVITTFYMMGFSTSWRPVPNFESSLHLDGMAEGVEKSGALIRDHMKERGIRDLMTVETGMTQLQHLTAGASNASKGCQLIFVRGRARIVVFVQDFGNSLFIRWKGYFDVSGRRLWLLIGMVLSFINQLIYRWTGTNPMEDGGRLSTIFSPASRRQVLLRSAQGGGIFARIFGMVDSVSEYAINELIALEGSVRDSIVSAVQKAMANHKEIEEIRAQIRSQTQLEDSRAPGRGRGRT